MKILHVFHHSNLLNGVDRSTITLLSAWQQLGKVEFKVLVPEEGDVTRTLDEMGISYRIAPLKCCTGPAKAAELNFLAHASIRAEIIENWLSEEHFDLIHLNTGHLLDGAIAGCKTNTPVIWHIHSPFEIDLARYSNFMGSEAYAWLLGSLGTHVLAVSDDVRDSLLPWLPFQRISTLYNGIDVEDLDKRSRYLSIPVRTELGIPDDTPLVLGVGRISAQKDFATFVRVAKLVVDAHPSVCFAIAGPAEEHGLADELPVIIDQLNLNQRVFLLGPRSDVPALLMQSDAFLSTAIFEGQGLAALEAMALKKPTIAMDCIGLRECLVNEVDSLTVPLGDIDACACAILRVLNDPDLARSLGEHGRQNVETQYSGLIHAKRFFEIAKSVVDNTPTGEQAAAADFVLGLLKKIREANDKIFRLDNRPKFQKRVINKIRGWFD